MLCVPHKTQQSPHVPLIFGGAWLSLSVWFELKSESNVRPQLRSQVEHPRRIQLRRLNEPKRASTQKVRPCGRFLQFIFPSLIVWNGTCTKEIIKMDLEGMAPT